MNKRLAAALIWSFLLVAQGWTFAYTGGSGSTQISTNPGSGGNSEGGSGGGGDSEAIRRKVIEEFEDSIDDYVDEVEKYLEDEADYEEAIEDIDSFIEEINETMEDFNEEFYDDSSEEPGGSDTEGNPEGGQEESSESQDQEEQIPEVCEEAISENTEAQIESELEADAETAGDPVLINIGEYIRTDTDLYLRKNFSLNRTYRSQSKITGTFGLGWASTIDQRIITGLIPEIETAYEECINRKRKLEDYLLAFEREIYEKYRITDLRAWEAEIDIYIKGLEKLLADSTVPMNKAKQLTSGFQISGWEDKVRTEMEKLEERINDLQHLKTILPDQLLIREKIKKGILREEKYLSKLNVLKEKNKERSRFNIKSDFDGTPDEWIFTGFGAITFIDNEGINHLCRWSQADACFIPESMSSRKKFRITKNKDGEYILKKKNGENFYFSSSGLIEKIADLYDNFIQFHRDINGKLFLIKTSFGEEYSVSYSKGRISSITNKRDSTESVSYSFEGNKLKTVTDSYGDSISFSYNDFGRIESLTKDDGSTVQFKSAEETSDGKKLITETVNEEGFSEYFVFDTANRTTEYTDHDGNVTLYSFNERNQTILRKGPDGDLYTLDYDPAGNLIYENHNGASVIHNYDLNGNLLQNLYSDGSSEIYHYDSKDNLIYLKNRDNIEIEFQRDEKTNLISARIDGIIPFSMEYDNRGLITKQTFFGTPDIIKEYFYDEHGNLKSSKCDKEEVVYSYDNRNRITSVTKNGQVLAEFVYSGRNQKINYPNGLEVTSFYNSRKDLVQEIKKDTVTGQTYTETYTYDKRHLPVSKKISDGENEILLWTKTWTGEGKLSKICEFDFISDKSQAPRWFTEIDYSKGNLKSVSKYADEKDKTIFGFSTSILNENRIEEIFTDPLGYTSKRISNSLGQVTEYTDENGKTYERTFSKTGHLLSEQNEYGGFSLYEYDSLGNIISVKEKSDGLITEKMSFSYSPDGRVTATVNSLGEKNEYFYDSQGRLIKVSFPKGNLFYEYDELGREKSLIAGPSNNRREADYFEDYEYSKDGREVKITYSGLITERYYSDAFGRMYKIENSEGNSCICTYNLQGQVASSTDFYGNITNYCYDGRGNLIRTEYPDGSFEVYEYDPSGLNTKASDNEGVFAEYDFDKKGNLIREKGRNTVQKEYAYDKTGKLISIFAGPDKQLIESFIYKNRGKTLEYIDGNKNTYSYFKDDFGKTVTEKNRLGKEKYFSYDAAEQLSQITDFNKNIIRYENDPFSRRIIYPEDTYKFKYDSRGNILEAENNFSSLSFTYNQCSLLETVTDNKTDETVFYTYDLCGRRSRVTGYGRDINYSYGKNGEILEVYDKITKQKVSFEYDCRMREIKRTFSNGVYINKTYDKAGRVTSISQRNNEGTLLFAEGYVYDENGRRCGTVNQDGLVTLYEYDSLGQISCVHYPATDDHINKIMKEILLIQNVSIDETSITESIYLTAGQTNPYLEVMKNFSDTPAVSSHQKIITERFAYDLNGNRTEKISPSGKMIYSYDQENRLKKITLNGKTIYSYVYDHNGNLLEEENPVSKKQYTYSSANRMTGFKELKEDGEVSYSFYYDPFNRRFLETSNSGSTIKTVYDAFSLDTLKKGLIYGNGLFTDSYRNTYQSAESIFNDDSRYHFMNDSLMSFENPSFAESLPLNLAGKVLCRLNGLKEEFKGIDILETVRNTTDETGNINKSFMYDVFGTPLSSDLSDYGFCGKPYNSDYGLYDFGFRDLSPEISRFTSADPIRDGENWYSYCMNDPLNFFDLWGLCSSEAFILITEKEDFNGMPSDVRAKIYKQLYNRLETEKLVDNIRSVIGAKYSHKRMPTEDEMDCSGILVYVLKKLGYEFDMYATVAKIVAGLYPGIKLFDDVKNDRQGLPGILNFYFFTDYFDHMNYGVGQEEGESELQVVDASYGDTWQSLRNKYSRQLQKAEKDKINKTYAPFSYNTDPVKQGYLDFTKFVWDEIRKKTIHKEETKKKGLGNGPKNEKSKLDLGRDLLNDSSSDSGDSIWDKWDKALEK